MVWQPEIDEIKHRRGLAEQLGGEQAKAEQHAQGKLTARERATALADAGSFKEIGALAGKAAYEADKLAEFAPSPTVLGRCTLNGRSVVVSARDPFARGEAPGTDVGYKMGYGQKMALQWQSPYIRLLDSGRGSVLELDRAARTYLPDDDTASEALQLLGAVPVVSAIMGSVSGPAAVDACLSHFSVAVKGTGLIHVGDPEAVKAALGQDSTEEEIGGASAQASAGTIDNLAENEEDAFAIIRRFLSYLPDSVWQMPPRVDPTDSPARRDEELLSIIPRNKKSLYDPYQILHHVLDHDSFFEIGPAQGRSTILGLGRADGYPVGVMIKNPMSSTVGALDVAAGAKMTRFLQLCDTFHLPMVYFVDEPGFMIGLEAQQQGIVRAGARLCLAAIQTRMPWISFVVRQLYGVAGCLFFRPAAMYKHYGWASANWGGMHVEGGTTAAYRRDIEDAPDPTAKREEIENRLRVLSSIFRTAEAFEVEDIIDPRETRPLLCDFLETAAKVTATQLGPSTGPAYYP